MMANALAARSMWTWELSGWRISLQVRREKGPEQASRAEELYRWKLQQAAARREAERQWCRLLLDKPLLNG